ncbi:DUF3307 domain-containing protein [Streptomyces goshikiensis]|uniref:DUF3307 domain-containing protein n=1 Tax=Streptomyces goshikiensis TaxID=1942 RepID=UPI003653A97B
MFATLFIALYLAHLAADYPCQTDAQARCKAGWTDDHGLHHHGWGAAAAHAATHVLLCGTALVAVALVLDEVVLYLWPTVAALAVIGLTHGWIDRRWPVEAWMRLARQTKWAAHGGAAHVDQTAHVLVLGVVALALAAVGQ